MGEGATTLLPTSSLRDRYLYPGTILPLNLPLFFGYNQHEMTSADDTVSVIR
jgi:hypothetical protein